MKSKFFPSGWWLLGALVVATESGHGATNLGLALQSAAGKMVLSWPASATLPDYGLVFPEFTVERSADLVHWEPVGGKLRGMVGRTGSLLTLPVDQTSGASFFRVHATLYSRAPQTTGAGGGEVFGYDTRFADELGWVGALPVEAFATNYPPPSYLPQIDFDPTTAQFWPAFSTNAAFRLNATELARFMTNGFVVSERLGSASFGGIYATVFHGDLPVFVTTDSILQAWHRTYLSLLEEVEELQLATLQEQVLDGMASRLPLSWRLFGPGPLSNSILDADYFLTVARSLWAGYQFTNSTGVAAQNPRVAAALDAVASLSPQAIELFGSQRVVDFTQFAPRGHYTHSDRLRRYFQTMMWCGLIDFRVLTFPPNQEDDLRQLGTALVLDYLLRQADQSANWSAIDQTTRLFAGPTDSLTFAQLDQLLSAAHLSLASFLSLSYVDLTTLTNLQTRLLSGNLGVQNITGGVFFSPWGPAELELPRSFTVFGQKFVMDSWAFQQVVFDKVHWTPDATPLGCATKVLSGKVLRRKPSGLDVAFLVFGNDQAVPDLVARILDPNGVPFRDGLPYQHNLTAARNVLDSQGDAVWSDNIYTAWLAALRALSAPTADPQFPEAMRTRAWAMKTLNTQLASWTELRHDTILYAKQSYTPPIVCSYPFGFVEPRLEFWQRMQTLANLTARGLSSLPLSGTVTVPSRVTNTWNQPPLTFDLGTVQAAQVAALQSFAAQMATLQGITVKELTQQPLTPAETDFLQSLLEYNGYCVSTNAGFTGWYPHLFYRNVFWSPPAPDIGTFDDDQGCNMADQLVTDVHTDVPDPLVCDPGAVLHEGLGGVHLLLIAVDNGPDRMVYAGPVFSHYEFEMPGIDRLTDADWKAQLKAGQKPPSPEWTQSYLVPSP